MTVTVTGQRDRSTTRASATTSTGAMPKSVTLTEGAADWQARLTAHDGSRAEATGTDTFTYTLSDGSLTDTAQITVTVTGVNDAPVGVADTLAAIAVGAVDAVSRNDVPAISRHVSGHVGERRHAGRPQHAAADGDGHG